MDQPPQQPQISTEGIIASILSVVATLGAIAVRGRLRIKGMREKVEAETAPQIEKDYLTSNKEIREEWREEVGTLRAQIDKVRSDYELRLSTWMDRAIKAENQLPELKAEIFLLKQRVADLEEEVAKARGRREDVR